MLPWALAIRWVWRWPPVTRYRGLRLPAAAALAVGHLVLAVGLARIHLALARSAAGQGSSRSVAASSPAPRAPGVGEPRGLPGPLSCRPVPCSHRGLGPELSALAGRRAGDLVVMTTMFEGPRLVWESGVRVVGTPYHRNAAGILDTDAVMAKADDEAAREVLEARGVDFLVICPTSSSVALLSRISPQGLASRLARGEVPSWLDTVAAGGAADRPVRAFRLQR